MTLTTNGILLPDQIDALVAAGICGINISLDTLNRTLPKPDAWRGTGTRAGRTGGSEKAEECDGEGECCSL